MNYFEFDDVEYYHKNITEKDVNIEYLKQKELKGGGNRKYLDIIEGNYPNNLNNSNFEIDLVKYGFKKIIILKERHSEINQIFSKKDCTELTTIASIPIYQDIFIFKKKGEIIGVAKVCFYCRNAYITGTKHNWDYFGECGDYEKLQEIIKTLK